MSPRRETSFWINRFEDGLKLYVPDYMRQGLRDYYYRGVPPGGLLTALLENDFLKFYEEADLVNQRNGHNYAMFIWNHMPIGAYGSPETVRKWMEARRAG